MLRSLLEAFLFLTCVVIGQSDAACFSEKEESSEDEEDDESDDEIIIQKKPAAKKPVSAQTNGSRPKSARVRPPHNPL